MRRVCALLLLAALGACGPSDGLPGGPGRLGELTGFVPAQATERGLFFGMGSLLPLDGSLGFDPEDIGVVLESGSPPLTVLHGDFDVGALAAAARRWGYAREDAGRWSLQVRSGPAPAGAPALVTAVPAFAASRSVVVLGSADEVRATLGDPEQPGWLDRAVRALGPDVTQAAIAPAVRLDAHARRAGEDPAALLARHGARARLGDYEGFALGRDDEDGGVLVLVHRPGGGGPEQAGALAQRLATTSLLGERGRRLVDDLTLGGPRWIEAADVVRLPLSWRRFEPDRVRADVEREVLLPLVPDPA
jgi:hypothetical protein